MTQSRSEGKTLHRWNLNPPLDATSHEVQQFESGSKNKLSASIHIEVGKGVTGSKRTIARTPFGINGRQKPVPASREQVIANLSSHTSEMLDFQLRQLMETSKAQLDPDTVDEKLGKDGYITGELASRQQPTGPTKGGL